MSSRGDSRDDRDRYDRDKDRYTRDRDDRYDGQAASPSRRDRLRSRSPARRDREKDRDSRDDRDDRAPDRDRRSIDKRDRNRDRSRSRSRDRRDDRRSSKHHRSKRSPSESDSESDSEDEERRRRRKKEKARRRDRDRSESDSESEGERAERKRRRKEKKVRKKEKKDKKKTSSSTAEWGKYGIIDDNDRQAKEAEFRSWMVEERMINPETLKKDKEKKEWAVFVEDFNTATLPHEKYYNMMAYSQKMDILRTGGTLASSVYDPNADMQAHSSSLRRPIIETETYLSKSQLEDLRRVQNERVEFGKRKTLGMDVSKTLGVRMDGSKFDAGRK